MWTRASPGPGGSVGRWRMERGARGAVMTTAGWVEGMPAGSGVVVVVAMVVDVFGFKTRKFFVVWSMKQ